MKRILISLLTFIFIVSIVLSVNAATSGTVTISSSKEVIKAGDEFSILVSASDSNNLNTVEYSGLTITYEGGTVSGAITVKSVEAINDNWAKLNNGGKTDFVYSGGVTQSQEVFKVTLVVGDNIVAGTYNINLEGLKVYSTNMEDDTTDIGTKSVSVKAIVDNTTAGGNDQNPSNSDNGNNSNDGTGNNGSTNGDKKEENKNVSSNKVSNTNKNTNTTKKLPQTGVESTTLFAIIALAVVGITSFISYRKYKNI